MTLGAVGQRDMESNVRSLQIFARCSKDRKWPMAGAESSLLNVG
jgi:hypothetical protein